MTRCHVARAQPRAGLCVVLPCNLGGLGGWTQVVIHHMPLCYLAISQLTAFLRADFQITRRIVGTEAVNTALDTVQVSLQCGWTRAACWHLVSPLLFCGCRTRTPQLLCPSRFGCSPATSNTSRTRMILVKSPIEIWPMFKAIGQFLHMQI